MAKSGVLCGLLPKRVWVGLKESSHIILGILVRFAESPNKPRSSCVAYCWCDT